MTNLYEWFDFCNYLQRTTNLNVVRIILLSSFTIGMPQYEIIIRDDNLFFKLITSDQQTDSSTTESQTINVQHDLSMMDDNKSTSSKKFQDKLVTNLNSQSSSSFQNRSNTKSSMTSIGADNEAYEPFIDALLDLSDIVDLTETQYGDTVNLILINRALILVDLMKHLDDKYFMESLAFKLGKLIDNIVTQVRPLILYLFESLSHKFKISINLFLQQNYPLNSTEKLKYSLLLESMANISIQINDFESSLRFFIKCIELLEDLYSGFHLVELNRKFKTKMQLCQINNRLSKYLSNLKL